MTSPRIASSPAYAASCRSKARQAAPMERAAQSVTLAGSARITPMPRSSAGRSSVRVVEVAALQQVELAVVLLDAVMELQVVLDDLGGSVALRPRVVGKGEHDQLRIALGERLEAVRIASLLGRVLGREPDEPRVERQPALAVAVPELGRSGLAGDDDREVDEVVRMAKGHDRPCRRAHRRESTLRRMKLVDQNRFEWPDDASIRPDDFPHELRLQQLATICQGRVRVDQLDRCHDVVALPDPGLVHLAREDPGAEVLELPVVARDDAVYLARQVDPGLRAEPEVLRPVGKSVDPEHAS